jgi:Domain of unknown function (DUF4398)
MAEQIARPLGRQLLWSAVCMASALAGCASAPPQQELVLAGAALDGAVSAGAAEMAPAELLLARNKFESAKVAAAKGDNDRARALAEEAEVDALLARNKAGAERSRRANAEVQQGLKAFQEQGIKP